MKSGYISFPFLIPVSRVLGYQVLIEFGIVLEPGSVFYLSDKFMLGRTICSLKLTEHRTFCHNTLNTIENCIYVCGINSQEAPTMKINRSIFIISSLSYLSKHRATELELLPLHL